MLRFGVRCVLRGAATFAVVCCVLFVVVAIAVSCYVLFAADRCCVRFAD